MANPVDEMGDISLEEERLYNMDDDELEKAVLDEKQEAEEEEVAEQSEESEEEDSETPDGDDEDNPEEEDGEDSDTADDEEEEEDSEEAEEADEEQPESETKSEDTLKPVKANGMDIPVKSMDEVYQMASMGVNYKRKMEDIAPYRRAVSAMKEHGLTDQDIALLVDIKNKDKAAIAKVLQDSEVDPLDLETESNNYEVKVYGKDAKTLELQDIEKAISSDPEYATTANVVNNMWDQKSQETLADNPHMVQGLHNDIKNGIYEKVAPEAARLEFLDQGKRSKLEYYIEAGKFLSEQQNQAAELEKQNKVHKEKKVAKKRKAAATTKSKATNSKTEEPDYKDMSDEDYDKFYKEVMMS